jgi:hypothetical protein
MFTVFIIILSLAGVIVGFSLTAETKQETWMVLAVVLPVDIAVLAAMYYTRLETRVTNEGIELRWWPFMKKFKLINWHDVERFEMRKSPLWSYGYKWSLSRGTIHNLSNEVGVQLYLKNRKKVFIGTQRTTALQHAVEEGLQRPTTKNNL